MFRVFPLIPLSLILSVLTAHAAMVGGRVLEVQPDSRTYKVELTLSKADAFKTGDTVEFKVGMGDAGIDYTGRLIQAEAVEYGGRWNLEKIFPVDGDGSKAYRDVNARLHQETATMSRRKFTRQGDFIPDFAGIDQHGKFVQIRELRGHPFILNFIFTRCQMPTMCPASTTRMSAMQDKARELGMEDLHFVTVTFDPAYDSPGILKQYAEGYGIEDDGSFYLLTGTEDLLDDLLRRFGILTVEEDGTINHTMATLLVDAQGRVAYRKEGSSWTTEEFLEEAKKL
ncbi:SCO family protein [Coraliomargarita parva]|uniref:SCO family protein n=1 Tax=Coraliomargarita parva TaxID=3014050 RepID=UPI0022B2CFAE|nr:SCO family protein [Coraliomargarita parva]